MLPSSDLLDCIARALEPRDDVAAAYLYGSAAEDRATPLSDVDVAILFRERATGEDDDRRGLALAEIGTAIRRALPRDRAEIDVRDLEALPLAVRGKVVTRGRLAVSADDERRVAFEVRTRLRYFDFLPFLRENTREGLRALRRLYNIG